MGGDFDRSEGADDVSSEQDETRRNILKTTGALATGGALGSLTGYADQQELGDADETSDAADESPAQETIRIKYWSQFPTANPEVRRWYPETLDRFEEMQDENVEVELTPVTPSGLLSRVRAAVEAGNPPDISGRGELGIDLYPNGVTVDHGQYVREENYSERMVSNVVQGSKFRDVWISMGRPASTVWTMGLRPKFFKEVGIDDPENQLSTWTDYRRAIEDIDGEFSNVFAHEETAEWNDLETYWGQARTAYQDGEDPWMDVTDRGSPEDPHVKIGEEPRTDGMIKNVLDLADAYSSQEAASRTDEEIPSLMFTDRVAAYHYGLGGWQRYRTVNEDVEFGWDGDVYEQILPKLDPNYGDEYDIPELAGKEGMHGSFKPSLGGTMIFSASEVKEWAWELEKYLKTDLDHLIPFRTNFLPRPPSWKEALETIRSDHLEGLPQPYQTVINASLADYADNLGGAGSDWEVFGASEIRWEMNRRISDAGAGEYGRDELPGVIREQTLNMLEEMNQGQSL
jgi:ABC-type glycerol-3-phosphate transport system substrate-binding protein